MEQSITKLPIVIKGILNGDDAKLAVAAGARAVWVSNHGGRTLDTVPATLFCLPDVVDACKGSGVEVYADGGVRRGTDALKLLALGADAVFVGRPVLWGLAVDGQRGVADVLRMLNAELELACALAGISSAAHVPNSVLWKHSHPALVSRL